MAILEEGHFDLSPVTAVVGSYDSCAFDILKFLN